MKFKVGQRVRYITEEDSLPYNLKGTIVSGDENSYGIEVDFGEEYNYDPDGKLRYWTVGKDELRPIKNYTYKQLLKKL